MNVMLAARGLVALLLSLPALQGNSDWGVTYTSNVCALRGSKIDIRCSYTYPKKLLGLDTTVEKTLWFTKTDDNNPVDLLSEPDYTGRVEHSCGSARCVRNSCNRDCSLTIKDLRESDSAKYKFRFITNQPDGKYTGTPGVTLSLTDLQVQLTPTTYSTWMTLTCHSICRLAGRPTYVWYKDGQYLSRGISYSSYRGDLSYGDSYSCAVEGYERFPSPLVCGRGNSCNRVSYTNTTVCALLGSSVDIPCTYSGSKTTTSSLFWFRLSSNYKDKDYLQPVDLKRHSDYTGRVEYPVEETGRSSLRINDLRETDSAEYRLTFNGYWGNRFHGTTVTVTGLRVTGTPVAAVTEGQSVTLTCSTSCPLTGDPTYNWYHNNGSVTGPGNQQRQLVLDSVSRQHAGNYSCSTRTLPHLRSPEETLSVKYAPKTPSVTVSPPGEIEEGTSVTLSCSSDANPAASYTWFKETTDYDLYISNGQQLVFRPILSSSSGQYFCAAKNELARVKSDSISITVNYGPKQTSVLSSASGEIEEGRSVTLSCSSDANPAASYTWFKDNLTLPWDPIQSYTFTSVTSEDRGRYHCQAENIYGRLSSQMLLLDVKYAPKSPSVTVSPSGEIEEGTSVTLSCSSDANPPASYTWFKENEDSKTKGSGQNFTITDITSELGGNYYCEARNVIGGHNSTFMLIVVSDNQTLPVVIGILAVLPVTILLLVFIWLRRKRASRKASELGRITYAVVKEEEEEEEESPVYANISAPTNSSAPAAQRQPIGEQEAQYAEINFKRTKAVPQDSDRAERVDTSVLYSTVKNQPRV